MVVIEKDNDVMRHAHTMNIILSLLFLLLSLYELSRFSLESFHFRGQISNETTLETSNHEWNNHQTAITMRMQKQQDMPKIIQRAIHGVRVVRPSIFAFFLLSSEESFTFGSCGTSPNENLDLRSRSRFPLHAQWIHNLPNYTKLIGSAANDPSSILSAS